MGSNAKASGEEGHLSNSMKRRLNVEAGRAVNEGIASPAAGATSVPMEQHIERLEFLARIYQHKDITERLVMVRLSHTTLVERVRELETLVEQMKGALDEVKQSSKYLHATWTISQRAMNMTVAALALDQRKENP